MIVTIELDNIELRAFHGCYELENIVGNNFRVDLSVTAEIGDAAINDDISSTVNYLILHELVCKQMKVISKTIEAVSVRILDEVFLKFPQVLEAKIRVCKLAPPLGGKVEKVCTVISRARS